MQYVGLDAHLRTSTFCVTFGVAFLLSHFEQPIDPGPPHQIFIGVRGTVLVGPGEGKPPGVIGVVRDGEHLTRLGTGRVELGEEVLLIADIDR